MAKITKRVVDAMAPGDPTIWDDDPRGFGVKVGAKGAKTYVVTYRAPPGGRTAPKRWYTIGLHGSPWTPDTARKEAKRILGLVIDGADPAKEKQEARAGHGDTVADAFDRYAKIHARPELRNAAEIERIFQKDIKPVIGSMRLEDVTRREMVKVHDRIAERGKGGARNAIRYASGFFSWCLSRDMIDTNPCMGMKLAAPAKRERVLTDAELVEVLRAADSLGQLWGTLIRTLALTGARLREIAEMRWEELDLAAGVLSLPPERVKNGLAHRIPLPPSLVEALAALPRMQVALGDPSPFVFTTTGRTPVSGHSKLKDRIEAAILKSRQKEDPAAKPMPDWRFHDLRRTCATGMGGLGINVAVIERALNHTSGTFKGIVGVYQVQPLWGERQRAFEAWERHVLALLSGKRERGNVVQLAFAES